MTRARVDIVSLQDTPWYHLVNRCVRRAFLCGKDELTGQDYGHRRLWIEARIRQLAGVFSIDVAAYSVMHNHYHVVVRVDKEHALALSRDEVLKQWLMIFSGAVLVKRYMAGENLGEGELVQLDEVVEVYRQRLFDVSWFMRVLNESIARMANKEDQVKGRFWEGRFKSQALLDDEAVLSVMAYVDLNPIRAGMADVVEESSFTSLYARLHKRDIAMDAPDSLQIQCVVAEGGSVDELPAFSRKINSLPLAALMPFDASGRSVVAVPFAYEDYFELVGFLGQTIFPDKRGCAAVKQPKLAKYFDVDQLKSRGGVLLSDFAGVVGCEDSLAVYSKAHNKKFVKGVAVAKRVYKTAA